ncbi:hypothetical protein Vadar_004403 [Vaccinium darrowii]|uniref:Uncharacterized protein n=1 Tax=Vaccinium darrowii TaxID=229202 RepID=A0ACB7Y4S5_9ERIC|nr:hypothetical protein Vadar_004403 [Vaccinium darrowii]
MEDCGLGRNLSSHCREAFAECQLGVYTGGEILNNFFSLAAALPPLTGCLEVAQNLGYWEDKVSGIFWWWDDGNGMIWVNKISHPNFRDFLLLKGIGKGFGTIRFHNHLSDNCKGNGFSLRRRREQKKLLQAAREDQRVSMAGFIFRIGCRRFSTLSPGIINESLASSRGLVDDVLSCSKTKTDLLKAFSRLKSSGRTCASSDIKFLQKKEEAPKFLTVQDFNAWYEKKPTEEFLKLNTDGSFKTLPNGSVVGGCGAVVRNWLGDVVSQCSWELPRASSSKDVEFSGIYLGVLHCKSLGFKKLEVESDCKELVLVLNSSQAAVEVESNSYRHLFKVLASLEDYRIQHQFREGNSVANELASLAMRGVVTAKAMDLYGE